MYKEFPILLQITSFIQLYCKLFCIVNTVKFIRSYICACGNSVHVRCFEWFFFKQDKVNRIRMCMCVCVSMRRCEISSEFSCNKPQNYITKLVVLFLFSSTTNHRGLQKIICNDLHPVVLLKLNTPHKCVLPVPLKGRAQCASWTFYSQHYNL